MEVYVNEQHLLDLYEDAKKRFDAVKPDAQNRYSVLRTAVIDRFLQYGIEDINNGMYERAVYVYDCITRLLDDLQNQKSFPDGVQDSIACTPRGYQMIDKEGRPVFFCGYGHFNQVRRDLKYMRDFGCNTIQIEIGPSYLLYPKGTHKKWNMPGHKAFDGGEEYIYDDGDFEVNLAYLKKDILPVLEAAQREKVAVCLLLSPHYAPNWIFEKYPDMRSKNIGFIKYNIYHPKAQEMLRVFINAVVPRVKDCAALQSICISNEPAFNTMADCREEAAAVHDLLPTDVQEVNGGNMLPKWRRHLSGLYGSIDALNEAWGSSYGDFSEVGMPDDADDTPQFYQWYLWNNRQFADWHKELAGRVKQIAPGVPVHAKFMPVFGSSDLPYHRRFLKYGIDPEQFAEFCDISGNDAWSFHGKAHLPLSYKLEWYDYLSSLSHTPIDNSEDHVIEDRDTDYSPIQAQRIYADMWQGALHGRSMTQIWVWERSNVPHATANGSILHRPDCVEAVGRACLDLNRLAYEAAAMQECNRRVAILYSKPSRVFNRDYSAQMFKAYEGVLYAGQRPYFITEQRLDALKDYDMLVVPGVTNICRETAHRIEEFIGSGKPVLIIDGEKLSLARDEYDKPLKLSLAGAVHISSKTSAVCPDADFSQKICDIVIGFIKQDIYIAPQEGGNYNIEWCRADYGERVLINLCSYDTLPRTLCIKCRDGKTAVARELITGREIDGSFRAEPYVPMLLEISVRD